MFNKNMPLTMPDIKTSLVVVAVSSALLIGISIYTFINHHKNKKKE